MKRTLLEWTGIFGILLGLTCLVFWGVSFFCQSAHFTLSFALMDLTAAHGNVVLCDHFGNLQVIELLDRSIQFTPAPVSVQRSTLPGFGYRHYDFAAISSIWSVSISLLIPMILLFTIGGLCIWRNRMSNRASVISRSSGNIVSK